MAESSKKGRLGQLQVAAVQSELTKSEAKVAELERLLDAATSARKPKALPKARRQPKLKGDKVRMLMGDLHGCFGDKLAVSRALSDAKELQPDEIVLGGDMVDCSGFLAQHHVLSYEGELRYSYQEDLASAAQFLDALQAACPNAKIEYLEGNHESRVEKWAIKTALKHQGDVQWLIQQNSAEHQLHLKERGIPYYRVGEYHDGLKIPGWIKRGKIYITHAISFAKHAAAQALAKTAGNVVFFHSHRADTFTTSLVHAGTVSAWNPGCLCGQQPLYRHSNPSGWSNGYAVQFVAKSENFLHLQVPIIEGESLLTPLLNK